MSNIINEMVNQISNLTVLEAAKLAQALKDHLGISDAPVAVAAVAAAPEAVAKTEFDVTLKEVGANKLNVIKEVRALTGLGLTEAKALVDSAPKILKSAVSKDEADKIKSTLEAAGAVVTIS